MCIKCNFDEPHKEHEEVLTKATIRKRNALAVIVFALFFIMVVCCSCKKNYNTRCPKTGDCKTKIEVKVQDTSGIEVSNVEVTLEFGSNVKKQITDSRGNCTFDYTQEADAARGAVWGIILDVSVKNKTIVTGAIVRENKPDETIQHLIIVK